LIAAKVKMRASLKDRDANTGKLRLKSGVKTEATKPVHASDKRM
jgi:hypothetical protein